MFVCYGSELLVVVWCVVVVYCLMLLLRLCLLFIVVRCFSFLLGVGCWLLVGVCWLLK